MKTTALWLNVFILLSFTAIGDNAHAMAMALLTEKEALNRLISHIQKDKLYDGWTTISCPTIWTEEKTKDYFDFAIHEKHNRDCPGDPSTSPIADRFRVDRLTGKIQWYNPTDDDLHPYKGVLDWRRQK